MSPAAQSRDFRWKRSIFSQEKCIARREISRFLEAERGGFFSTPPPMRPDFAGFKLLCNTWGERMRSRWSYFLLVAFPTPPFEASKPACRQLPKPGPGLGCCPPCGRGPFHRQHWNTTEKGVAFTQGSLPAGIQGPPKQPLGLWECDQGENKEEQHVP